MQISCRASLYTRVMLAVAVVTAVGVISLSLWTSHRESQRLQQMLRQDALVLCANFAETLAHQMVVEDYAGAESFMERAMRLPNLLRFQLCDLSGRVVGDVQRSPDGKGVLVSHQLQRLTPPTAPEAHLVGDAGRGVVWQPIQAGSLLGWLRVEFSLDQIARMRADIWQQGLLLGLFWVLGICLLVMVLIRPNALAIRHLAAFAHELPIRKGETITIKRGVTELEELGGALNHASTELARIERELLELNQTLQNRVEDEVAKSREKDALLLQQARYQTLGELLVNISHHWRQPLNAIGASIQQQAWQIANGELSPDQAIPKAEEVMVILQQLSHSLEGFRQLCQPAASSVTFSPSAAVAVAVAAVSEGYGLHGIEIRQQVVDERPLYGPQQELVQVLLNLLSNARDVLVANQVTGGLIVVQVTLPTPYTVQISIADNGGGIPEQVQATLFDPYVTTKFRAQGVGLGLFVVRQLVEQRFCGTVEACNSGDGARLTLTIPAAPGGSTT